ncbi:MAG TPA: hypothetical protein EYP30_05105 [Archaeoglobaceae archaeon]|nr:hypothetical protein [Archaeoglobaceae archaeon]
MIELKDIRIDIKDFEEWLKERGYDSLMHKDHFKIYLDVGLAGLFFSNSPLLLSYIFTKLGLPSERISPRVRIELGRKVREIKVGKDYLEINF